MPILLKLTAFSSSLTLHFRYTNTLTHLQLIIPTAQRKIRHVASFIKSIRPGNLLRIGFQIPHALSYLSFLTDLFALDVDCVLAFVKYIFFFLFHSYNFIPDNYLPRDCIQFFANHTYRSRDLQLKYCQELVRLVKCCVYYLMIIGVVVYFCHSNISV